MGKKLKVRTFNFPNWIKNLDQILYNILFMSKSIYNNRGSIQLPLVISVEDHSQDYDRTEYHNQDAKQKPKRNPQRSGYPPP